MEQLETLKRLEFLRGQIRVIGKIMTNLMEKGLMNNQVNEVLVGIFNEVKEEYDKINAEAGSDKEA